jgi:hypothetical protein
MCAVNPSDASPSEYNVTTRTGRIPVAARSKVWFCGRSLLGIAGSNPAGGMDVCLVNVVCSRIEDPASG